ncbi:MAG: HNH endonuclease signature motif containing protein [Pirellulaceae bacterium]|nr:HNH endonuclease signature motif containing protein [Pirellulaceae bacterium]
MPNEVFVRRPMEEPIAQPEHLGILVQPHSQCRAAIHPQIQSTAPRPTGRVTAANVMRLLEYQHFCCALTGRRLGPDTASLDHILPVRCGGEHVIENTQVLHKDVNRAKTTMTSEEFIELCREVVIHFSTCQFEVSPPASLFFEE